MKSDLRTTREVRVARDVLAGIGREFLQHFTLAELEEYRLKGIDRENLSG